MNDVLVIVILIVCVLLGGVIRFIANRHAYMPQPSDVPKRFRAEGGWVPVPGIPISAVPEPTNDLQAKKTQYDRDGQTDRGKEVEP